MAEFTMPSLGADMESGQLLEWMVKPGDTVQRGDIIAIVGTEKGEIEIEVFEDGTVEQLLVEEGADVPVGEPVAILRGEGEAVPAAAAEPKAKPPAEPHPMDHHALAEPAATPAETNGHRVRISPLARKLAADLGVDLKQVTGTGPHGAISKADVEKAAASMEEAPPPAPPKPKPEPAPAPAPKAPPAAKPARPEPPKARAEPAQKAPKAADEFQQGMRRAIARAMARANQEIPHYYVETRIDMQKALAWLEAENQKRSIKDRVLPAVILIKAVAKALTKAPQLNGYWMDDRLQTQEGIHIGFAIALRQGGLVTPAIHHADLKDMDELMADLRDLIMRTRAGRLRSSEMTDATITLTNLGDLGVEKVYGVIYPPQVALVGFGKVMEQPWVENGMLGIRPVLTATLAGDHRATDGRTGAQFLEVLNKILQEPDTLWD
jgi:pyruvate dehydrogenase E2 component (dihydrolipoamide acetyltransferase)